MKCPWDCEYSKYDNLAHCTCFENDGICCNCGMVNSEVVNKIVAHIDDAETKLAMPKEKPKKRGLFR